MATVAEFIQIIVIRATKALSRAGFGIPLAMHTMDATVFGTDRTRRYSSFESFETDFPSGTEDVLRDAVRKLFSQSPAPQFLIVGRRIDAPLEPISDALTAISDSDPDYYFILSTTQALADQTAISGIVETQKRIYITSSNAVGIPDSGSTTDIAAVSQTSNLDRTSVMFHKDADTEFPDFAWVGRQAPKAPGSTTWMYQELNAVAIDKLTDTESTNVRNKNANTYENLGGVGQTLEGKVASGEFIDIIRGSDWLEIRTSERIFKIFKENEKVGFIEDGIGLIEAGILAQIQEGIQATFLTDQFSTSVPDPDDIDPIDKAARNLPDVEATVQVQGAIHSVKPLILRITV